jgi:hypothetical protein
VGEVEGTKRRRRFGRLQPEDLALLEQLDQVDPDLGDQMERFLRAGHRAGARDLLSHATLESDLEGDLPVDELAAGTHARFVYSTGGGRHRQLEGAAPDA